MGKSQRTKGRRYENELVRLLTEAGVEAERISRTGSPDNDVKFRYCLTPNVTPGCINTPNPMGSPIRCGCPSHIGEVKFRTAGFKQDHAWLQEPNYCVFKRTNGKPWLVTLRLSDFLELIK